VDGGVHNHQSVACLQLLGSSVFFHKQRPPKK
jgi:hypothetical protein